MNDRWIPFRVPIVRSSWDPVAVRIVSSALVDCEQVVLLDPKKRSRDVDRLLITGMLLHVINHGTGK